MSATTLDAHPTRARALAAIALRLERAGIPVPEREAEWLLLHALRTSRAGLWAEPNRPLTGEQETALEDLARRRASREPLQLLLGEVPFHEVTLQVEPGVFIPRPETEELVEAALHALGRAGNERPGTLLDWGTGTGAVAIALLSALPGWSGVAADRSPAAVDLARRNAARNGVARRLRVLTADFADPRARALPGARFDLVVSNPPYIPSSELERLMPEVRDHDPADALDGGPDGLDAFRRLASGLDAWLRPGGLLALEIGADQADPVLGLLSGLIQDARILHDAAGRPRIAIGMRPSG